jgi:hypothetical protein
MVAFGTRSMGPRAMSGVTETAEPPCACGCAYVAARLEISFRFVWQNLAVAAPANS